MNGYKVIHCPSEWNELADTNEGTPEALVVLLDMMTVYIQRLVWDPLQNKQSKILLLGSK